MLAGASATSGATVGATVRMVTSASSAWESSYACVSALRLVGDPSYATRMLLNIVCLLALGFPRFVDCSNEAWPRSISAQGSLAGIAVFQEATSGNAGDRVRFFGAGVARGSVGECGITRSILRSGMSQTAATAK